MYLQLLVSLRFFPGHNDNFVMNTLRITVWSEIWELLIPYIYSNNYQEMNKIIMQGTYLKPAKLKYDDVVSFILF